MRRCWRRRAALSPVLRAEYRPTRPSTTRWRRSGRWSARPMAMSTHRRRGRCRRPIRRAWATVLYVLAETIRHLGDPGAAGDAAGRGAPARPACRARRTSATSRAGRRRSSPGTALPQAEGVFPRFVEICDTLPMLVDSHCHLDYATPEERPAYRSRGRGGRGRDHAHHLHQARRVRRGRRRSPRAIPTSGARSASIRTRRPPRPMPTRRSWSSWPRIPRSSASARPGSISITTTARATRQAELFRAHVAASRATGLPLIVHTRDADAETVAILREERPAKRRHPLLQHRAASLRKQRWNWAFTFRSPAS